VVALARAAEAGGFDVLSVFQDLGFQPAIVPLTLIAHVTERVRLGPAALNPLTIHPFEIASQIAALDTVAGGRAYLGLVTGAWLEELGLHEPRPLLAMREAVEVVRRALAGDRSGFAGERFTVAPGRALEVPVERPRVPLMIGTWKPRLAAFAGEVADEVKIGGCANPDMVRLMREWIGNERVRIVVGAVTVVDEDGDAARERARREVELYLPIVGTLDPTLDLVPGQEPPLDRFVIAGTPAEVIAKVEELRDAGAGRVELGPPQGRTTAAGIHLLARRVVPHFRR